MGSQFAVCLESLRLFLTVCDWAGEGWWSSPMLFDDLIPVWWLDLSNEDLLPVFLASLYCRWASTTTGSGTTTQMTILSPWVSQPTSSFKLDPPANLRVLPAPFSLILFNFHLSFKLCTHAGLSQSTASTLGLVSVNVPIPWGSADGTRKGTLGEDAFRY